MTKMFDIFFRVALLLVLAAGLIVAAWHISWLHSRAEESRYEIRASGPIVLILDKQERVVYAASGILGDQPVAWHKSPLPKEP